MRKRGERAQQSWVRDGAAIHRWLVEPLSAEVKRSVERVARAAGVVHVAVMPDVHLSREVCVGLAIATRDFVYPQAIGGDIGCGMLALGFDASADVLRDDRRAAMLLEELREVTPPMRHRSLEAAPHLPEDLEARELSNQAFAKYVERDGRVELGTLGRGNHFIEFQADEDDRLWLMIHSGSRCVGQRISDWHLSQATERSGGLAALPVAEPRGQTFLADAAWAARYASFNRRTMRDAIVRLMAEQFGASAIADSQIECDHNHVRLETHFGESLWVHRKGAASANPGEWAVIPGSMGTRSVHVVGRGCELALRSSSHGAGRALSRSEATRAVSTQLLLAEMRGVRFDDSIAAKLREEAPSAYKDIDAVMRAQRELTKIVRRLRPVLVYKAL